LPPNAVALARSLSICSARSAFKRTAAAQRRCCQQRQVRRSQFRAPCRGRSLHDGTEFCIIFCVKTTLETKEQLIADAKALAAQQRTSLTGLIEEGLQLRLRAQSAVLRRGKLSLPVFKESGALVAGVDSLSNKALLRALGDDA
jgi:hypothetical protein